MKTIDARGVSCPEPILRLKNGLKNETEILLLVDSKNALENCRNYAQQEGYLVEVTLEGDTYQLHVSKKA